MKSKSQYTIRQVIELTGVTEFSLRGWENRYNAVKPDRTQSDRRLYSQTDILRIKALKDLTGRGHKISKIANLSLSRLQLLVEDRKLLKDEYSLSKGKSNTSKVKREDFEAIIRFADQFKWDDLYVIITKQRKNLKPLMFVHEFLVPLIAEMINQVERGALTIAQEHILSSIIKEQLALLRSKVVNNKSKVRLIMASPEGDQHEIGLLIASTIAALRGIHVLYLGPHMPKRDFCEACMRYQATHALLVSTVSKAEGATEDIIEYLHFLDRHLVKNISVWVAGRNTQALSLSLKRDFKVLKSFDEFESAFKLNGKKI